MRASRLVSALLFSLLVGFSSACSETQEGDKCLSDTDCGFGFDCDEFDDNGVGRCFCVLEDVCGAGAQLEGEADELESGFLAPEALDSRGQDVETFSKEVETAGDIVSAP